MFNKTFITAIWMPLLFTLSLPLHAQVHTNREIATQFLDSVVNKKDFQAASHYLGATYIEHDPQGRNGAEGLAGYIKYLQENFPQARIDMKRVIVDGDYVLFHVHSILTPGSAGQAIVDIFRLENGKVMEHWDVTQEIPMESANDNGMF